MAPQPAARRDARQSRGLRAQEVQLGAGRDPAGHKQVPPSPTSGKPGLGLAGLLPAEGQGACWALVKTVRSQQRSPGHSAQPGGWQRV